MAKPIITLNGLKIVIMLGMLVIILTGIRFAADIIVPFVLAIFLAVVINPLVQLMVRCRVPIARSMPMSRRRSATTVRKLLRMMKPAVARANTPNMRNA